MANKTINYYNNNAESYYDQTVNIDFEDLYEKFLKYIPDGGSIMDVGCGSLLHLTEDKCDRFLTNLKRNLKPGGVIFISVKTGIETGCDEKGRYMQNYTESSLNALLTEQNQNGNELKVIDTWLTKDSMNREVEWINMLVMKGKA